MTLNARRGRGAHRKYRPYAFTEQGVAMLSSVLRSPRAVQVNIEIMRAFVRLRRMLKENVDLARKLATSRAIVDGFGSSAARSNQDQDQTNGRRPG